MREKRMHHRFHCDDEAVIVAPGSNPIFCRVTDRSEGGVRLSVLSVLGIPDRFKVRWLGTGMERDVAVCWRAPGALGAQFLDIEQAAHPMAAE